MNFGPGCRGGRSPGGGFWVQCGRGQQDWGPFGSEEGFNQWMGNFMGRFNNWMGNFMGGMNQWLGNMGDRMGGMGNWMGNMGNWMGNFMGNMGNWMGNWMGGGPFGGGFMGGFPNMGPPNTGPGPDGNVDIFSSGPNQGDLNLAWQARRAGN